ncbi:MAG: DUF2905 domain-containing protein [Bryobacterales bacterium]|nr:DUF2905 domain-containing protein [Bryobacterales bacterium]
MREEIGRALIVLGLVLGAAGFLFLFADRLPLGLGGLLGKLGRLPGDIVWKGESSTFYFPIVTCLMLSAVLSLLFWWVSRR